LLKRPGLIDELDLMHIHGEGHYYERKLNRDHIHMAVYAAARFQSSSATSLKSSSGKWRATAAFGSWYRDWRLADIATPAGGDNRIPSRFHVTMRYSFWYWQVMVFPGGETRE
jgi:hypothetical protein